MNKTKILQLIILIILLIATVQLSTAQTQKISFVPDSALTQVVETGKRETRTLVVTDCETDLATANSRLVKTLDALEKAESLIKVLENEIEARKRLESVNNEIISAKDMQISEQKKLIAILEKQSQRKISFLWGILKIHF